MSDQAGNLQAQAIALYRGGHFDEALPLLETLCADEENLTAWNVRGLALKQLGRFSEALTCFQHCLQGQPGHPAIVANAAACLTEAGHYAAAIELCAPVIAAHPDAVPCRVNLAKALIGARRESEAIDVLLALLAEGHEIGDLSAVATALLLKHGRFHEALRLADQAVQHDQGNPAKQLLKARALAALQRYNEAYAILRPLLNQGLRDEETQFLLGQILYETGQVHEAEQAFREVIAKNPQHLGAYSALAHLLDRGSRISELEALVALAEANCGNTLEMVLYRATLLRRAGANADAIALLESFDLENSNDWPLLMPLYYLLGDLHDRANDAQRAFACFEKANGAARQIYAEVGADKAPYLAMLRRVTHFFEKSAGKPWAAVPPPQRRSPVFLVGFPRSGTTLLDSILRAHPEIAVVEEEPMLKRVLDALGDGYPDVLCTLTQQRIEELQDIYFDELKHHINAGDDVLVVDKLPLNIIHVGLIQRIFQDAKIIFALRHPCDSMLSCFMQNFQPNDAMANFLSIEDSAHFYDQVMRLWKLYGELLPINSHTLCYEDLLRNFDGTVRALLDFLQLPWNDAVTQYSKAAKQRNRIKTPSYHQVTEPLYQRANGRWVRYRQELGSVLPILDKWIREFGYQQ